RAELLGIFAFWTLLAVLTSANRLADQRDLSFSAAPHGVPFALAFQQMYLWALLTPLVFWLASRFNTDQSAMWVKLLVLVAIGVVIAFSGDLINSTLVRVFEANPHPDGGFGRRGPRGPPRPTNVFSVLRGPMVLNHFLLFWGVLAAGFARDYFFRFRARERETAQLQTQLAEAKLSALHAQLNPHFLFNTLNAVSSLVERDPRGVRRMIARLSELLRYTLDGTSEQEIPLARELEMLRLSLDIMWVRFQGRLAVDLHVDHDVMDALVPNFVLQPLVENAVMHGVAKVEGTGRIELRARRSGGDVVITVRDNGPGLDAAIEADRNGSLTRAEGTGSGGVGLSNTRARLEQLYGADQHLSLRRAGDAGTVAEIVMPYHTASDVRIEAAPAIA